MRRHTANHESQHDNQRRVLATPCFQNPCWSKRIMAGNWRPCSLVGGFADQAACGWHATAANRSRLVLPFAVPPNAAPGWGALPFCLLNDRPLGLQLPAAAWLPSFQLLA